VQGAIGDRYEALGGASSWPGFPTSDEEPFAEDGRVSEFEHGAIYWWTVLLMEHDEDDPDTYKGVMKTALTTAAVTLTAL